MMRLVVVVVAIVAGGGAGWLALQATWREPLEAQTVVVEAPKVDVLTPKVDLLRGARIEGNHLAWSAWPAEQVSSGMILKSDQADAPQTLAGRVLRSNVYAGDPVRMQHLAQNPGGYLSMALQPGMRAIGIQISEDKSAGGFVLPNDRVDVLHTVIRNISGGGTATGATRTILTNVRVLAIGQISFDSGSLVVDDFAGGASPGAGGDGSTLIGKTATLEVSARQAEILQAAAASGQLALALRAADDFGLSGIGDLSLIEGVASPVAPDDLDAGDLPLVAIAEAQRLQREVIIISAGVPRTVVTGLRAQTDE